MEWVLIYLAAINVITFILYGIDKWKAIHKKWRIRESVLLLFAFIGGSVGAIIGMQSFRHKTQKAKFKFGVPIMFIIHIAIVIYLKTAQII